MILSDLQNQVTARLGTEVTTSFTSSKKTAALNTVRKRLLLEYDFEEFIKESTISCTSGEGTLPTDYLRTVKEIYETVYYPDSEAIPQYKTQKSLWKASDETIIYKRVSLTQFDSDAYYTWTLKQGTTGGTFLIYPAETVSVKMRYYYLPVDMSAGSDSSGLPIQFDEIHALMAARQLLFDDRQYDVSSALDEEIRKRLADMSKKRQDYGQKSTSSFKRALNGNIIII